MFTPENYPHQLKPFEHQVEFLNNHYDDKAWGLLWEQGTCKTKPIIDNASILYSQKKINGLLVVAPSGVERNWRSDEIPTHMPIDLSLDIRVQVFNNHKKHTQEHKRQMESLFRHDGLSILLMSYDAIMSEEGKKLVWRFLQNRECMFVLDEAHNIKSPNAKRTKRVIAAGKYAKYRRILTGTPISIGPFDLYSQINFLDEWFWKNHGIHGGSVDFRNFFGQWELAADVKRLKGYDPGYDKLLGYQNIEKLQKWLKEISDRRLKKDVLDLPSKIYSKRYFELSSVQKAAMEELKENLILEIGDHIISADLPIVAMLRYQQIACNYVPVGIDEPVHMFSDKNPRLGVMEEIRDEVYRPGIVWARFKHDIDQLMDLLGKDAVRYDGTLTPDEAERNKLAFQHGDKKWFVGNAQKGGSGLTLTVAKTTVYYSNSFRYIDRVQSEDRNHRGGMDDESVNYIDILGDCAIDKHIVNNLRTKRNVSNEILEDDQGDWI
jgi:SNF2 family DNA or RNA helicase